MVVANNPLPLADRRRRGGDCRSHRCLQNEKVRGDLQTSVVRELWLPWLTNAFPKQIVRALGLVAHRIHFLRRGLHHVVSLRTLHSELIGIVEDFRQLIAKIVVRRWRGGSAPLQGRRLPWIVRRRLAPEATMNQVVDEDQLYRAGKESRDGDEAMQRNQWLQIVVNECLVAADISRETQVMERHEDRVGSNEAEPEMQLAQSFVHHAAEHLGEPEIGSGKNSKHGRYTHDHMEVANHEVSGMQHDVERGLRQEESTHAAGDEH